MLDTSSFTAKTLARDPDFWVAILTAVALFLDIDPEVAAPIIAYLVARGYVRGKGVQSYGHAAAAEVGAPHYPLPPIDPEQELGDA